MLTEANTLLVDQPTNHLDLESIQSVNKGLLEYQGALIMTSHDHKMLNSVCNKVVEIGRYGSYVYEGTFDDYLDNERIREQKENIYNK
jgi:ATPase subunit of ABC transporter with duplicated ATPase domains